MACSSYQLYSFSNSADVILEAYFFTTERVKSSEVPMIVLEMLQETTTLIQNVKQELEVRELPVNVGV